MRSAVKHGCSEEHRRYTGHFRNVPLPAHTLIGVAALAFSDMMVEIDVTATTPE
jgi:enamine deaminase RidA (YjgF/YER057c/UK114 family)